MFLLRQLPSSGDIFKVNAAYYWIIALCKYFYFLNKALSLLCWQWYVTCTLIMEFNVVQCVKFDISSVYMEKGSFPTIGFHFNAKMNSM